ncbi:MAG: hypothetical protein K9M14_05660, partial [Candidatus Omnitrophica bacterium]|nr:hypothetical protein [Candidatus Omnitrophota bacterium]
LPSDYLKLSSQEAKRIKGAEAHWSQASGMFSDNAATVNDITSDIKSASLNSLAVSVGSAFVFGGMNSWGAGLEEGALGFELGQFSWSMPDLGGIGSSVGKSMASGAVMGAVSGIGDIKGWDTQTVRVVGSVVGGGAFGGMGMASYGAIDGGLKGLAIGALSNAASVLAYDAIEQNMDDEWGQVLGSLGAGIAGRYAESFATAGLGGFDVGDGSRSSWADAFGKANQSFMEKLPDVTQDAISSSIEVIGETQFGLDPVYAHAIGSFAGSITGTYLNSRLNQPPIEGWEEMNKGQREDALRDEFAATPEWGTFTESKQDKILDTALAAFDSSWVNLVAGGLLKGAFSLGVAYTEDWVGENLDFGSFHTPLTEAMVTNAITGVAKGIGEWAVGKTPWYDTLKNTFAFHSTYLASEGISGLKTNLGDFFTETKPPSLIGSIINNTASSLKIAGLDTLTLGGYGYDPDPEIGRDAYSYMSMQVGPQGVFMPQITPFEGIDALRIIDGDTQHNISLAQAFQQTSGYEDYDYFDKEGNLNQSALEDALEDYQNQDVSYEWQIIQGMHNLGHDIYHQGSISNLTGIIQATPAFKYFGYQPVLPTQIKLPNLSSEGEQIKSPSFVHYHATLHKGGVAWAPTNINSKSPKFYEQAFSENGARHWETEIDFGNGNVKSLSLTKRMNPIINYYESGGERLATGLFGNEDGNIMFFQSDLFTEKDTKSFHYIEGTMIQIAQVPNEESLLEIENSNSLRTIEDIIVLEQNLGDAKVLFSDGGDRASLFYEGITLSVSPFNSVSKKSGWDIKNRDEFLNEVKELGALEGDQLYNRAFSIMNTIGGLPDREGSSPEKVTSSGKGVNLDYLYSIYDGSKINISEGKHKISVDFKNKNLSFAPIYSPGAVWQDVSKFNATENQEIIKGDNVYTGTKYSGGVKIGENFSVGKFSSATAGLKITGTPDDPLIFAVTTGGGEAGLTIAGHESFSAELTGRDFAKTATYDYDYQRAFNLVTESDLASRGDDNTWGKVVNGALRNAFFDNGTVKIDGNEFNIVGGKVEKGPINVAKMWLRGNNFTAEETVIKQELTKNNNTAVSANNSIGVVDSFSADEHTVTFSDALFTSQEPLGGKLQSPFFSDLSLSAGASWGGNIPLASKEGSAFKANEAMPDIIAHRYIGKNYIKRSYWAATSEGTIDNQSGLRFDSTEFDAPVAHLEGFTTKNLVTVFKGDEAVDVNIGGSLAGSRGWKITRELDNQSFLKLAQRTATKGNQDLTLSLYQGFETKPPVSAAGGDAPINLINPLRINVESVTGAGTKDVSFRLDKSLILENFDPYSDKLSTSLVIQAGNLTYTNVRAEVKKGDISEATLGIEEEGSFALPIARMQDKAKEIENIIYVGAGASSSQDNITFSVKNGNIVADQGAARLLQTISLSGQPFETKIETKDGGALTLNASGLWKMERSTGSGWEIPEARVDYADNLSFIIEESNISRDVAYQDGRSSGGFHYGVKGLSFVPSGLIDAEGAPSSENRLGYDHSINLVSQNKGIVSVSEESIVPVKMGVSGKGALSVQFLTEATGMSWERVKLAQGNPAKFADVKKDWGEEGFAVHFSKRTDDYGNINDLFIGAVDDSNKITFTESGIIKGAAALQETTAKKGYFEIKAKDDRKVIVNVIPKILTQDSEGQWETAKGSWNFGDLYENKVSLISQKDGKTRGQFLDISYQSDKAAGLESTNNFHYGLNASTGFQKAREFMLKGFSSEGKSEENGNSKPSLYYQPGKNILVSQFGLSEKGNFSFNPVLDYKVVETTTTAQGQREFYLTAAPKEKSIWDHIKAGPSHWKDKAVNTAKLWYLEKKWQEQDRQEIMKKTGVATQPDLLGGVVLPVAELVMPDKDSLYIAGHTISWVVDAVPALFETGINSANYALGGSKSYFGKFWTNRYQYNRNKANDHVVNLQDKYGNYAAFGIFALDTAIVGGMLKSVSKTVAKKTSSSSLKAIQAETKAIQAEAKAAQTEVKATAKLET